MIWEIQELLDEGQASESLAKQGKDIGSEEAKEFVKQRSKERVINEVEP
jgi:hypothetical protein